MAGETLFGACVVTKGKHSPDRRKFDFQANEHPVTTYCFLLQIALRASNELKTCFQSNTNAITTFRSLFQPIFG